MSAVGHLAFLQEAFDRFASLELGDFLLRWDIKLHEVESLKPTSAMILAFYDEAEVKQFTNSAVKLWLDHLKQLLYDAEDKLDEYATELLQLKLESARQTQQGIQRLGSIVRNINENLKSIRLESDNQTHHHQTQQVHNSIPLTPGESSVSSLLKSEGTESAAKGINERFGSELRGINERLKSAAQGGDALGLNSSMGSGPSRLFSQKPPTSSLVIRSQVYGREEDMWKIIKWLLSDDKTPSRSKNDTNFSVLPIVGMGGAGKTTLARLVYNHEIVKKHFGLKAWVCVSENFDVQRLTKEILESATGSSSTSNSLDLLQVKLQEALSEKRFLLVLDDVWNENYERWDALSTAFAFGKPGSKVLITTRNKSVSSVVRTVLKDHDLKGLSDEACFALVKRHAFIDEDSSEANTKLEVFGQEIVNKSKGSPLAVKTLAGLLRDKREDSEWKDILENEIWDLKEGEILPSLMLSYHHLPPILKRCFAYCALFPKDYVFNKIELVLLWMAEGIVQPKGRKRIEDIGAGYFDELFMRSLFELSDHPPSNPTSPFGKAIPCYKSEELFYDLSEELHIKSFFESSNNTGSGFVMHDLIHDLAQFVSNGIYCRREYDKPANQIHTTTRHLSYLTNYFEATECEAMKSMRTFIDVNYHDDHWRKIFPTLDWKFQFQFLRMLRFRHCRLRELPYSIGKLKHLRLLDLSFSHIVRLPNSITSLYNLQTLVLAGCQFLRELPEDMGNLVNLRHLFLPETKMFIWDYNRPWTSYKMPSGVGNFSLQTLSKFVVGSKNISELRDLSQLRGALHVSNLENVGNNGTEAIVADLKNKPHLLGLRLHWSHYRSDDSFVDLGRDEKVEEDVLCELQPHTNLEALWIENYGGTRFPSWIEHPSFTNLETVSLINCHKCKFLPHLRELPLLKHLVIIDCSATKMVGRELFGEGSSSVNKQFRSLEKLHMERMEEWEEWPEVDEEGEGQFPRLRELIIRECQKLRRFSHHCPGLVNMVVHHCNGLRELRRLPPSLQELFIYCCPNLVVLTDERFYSSSSLSSLSSSSTPYTHNSLPCLRELHIRFCSRLRELPRILPSLESLLINGCEELCSLPMLPSIKDLCLRRCKGMLLSNKMEPHLSSLSSLIIEYVSDLKSLPHGFMHLLHKLTNLEKLEIVECSFLRECKYLEPLHTSGLHSLTSLQKLVISGCPALVSIPKDLLPTSLREFCITSCPILESIHDGLSDLSSLKRLEIKYCTMLTQWYRTEEGEEWLKSAKIPEVLIDDWSDLSL